MARRETLKDITRLLNSSADRRISQATLNYWKSLPEMDDLVVATARLGDALISVAACQIRLGETHNSIILTAKQHRRKGYAKEVLKAQLIALKGIQYKAGVAEDNTASRATMEACGLRVIDVVQATRSAGTFNRLIFGQD